MDEKRIIVTWGMTFKICFAFIWRYLACIVFLGMVFSLITRILVKLGIGNLVFYFEPLIGIAGIGILLFLIKHVLQRALDIYVNPEKKPLGFGIFI